MIGSNDFCTDLCYSPDIWATPEKHKKDIENVLDYLQANLPRTIVNFVVAPSKYWAVPHIKSIVACKVS